MAVKRIKLGRAYKPVEIELEFPDGNVKTFTVDGALTEETLTQIDSEESNAPPSERLGVLFKCKPEEFKGLDLRDLGMIVKETIMEVMQQAQGKNLDPTKGAEKPSPTS